MSIIRDPSLWESGARKIQWVKQNMSILRSIEEDFLRDKPFTGLKVALSIHLEAKTAYLCKVLAAGGAEMYITGSNPLSTQDDVAAALVHDGLNVFAWHGATAEEYHEHISEVVKIGPNIIIDDGGDLVNLIHTEYPELIPNVIGGCEETTTGIIRLIAMNKAGELKFPMALVNDARCKHLFDNRYGTGQSVWDGINRTTNLIVAGKYVVVAGYGWCGKGVAMRAKGLGAKVIITEVEPVKALEAAMDGFTVMKMEEAAKIGDFFVTVTGCKDVITEKSFMNMKDGAILCNAGHFDCEVDVAWLRENCVSTWLARNNIDGFKLSNGNSVYVIGEGRLVNLAAGDGHPAEIMDMSFGIQALTAAYLANNRDKLTDKIIYVPDEVDNEVADRKLRFWGIEIDKLTPEQEKYLSSWQVD
ncbi:MAG: adenosylhomocysteinase [Ruminococcus sp.]|nr:adenosylhomocysteinase [Ruminococcus sp.]MBP8593481.1 adenosylhomocysteinase [Ruminococcus sp.]MBQ8123871.1 adenosylhomocysteinase [Ruminococcus sp.]HOO05351.1 adenosylhomocysteinase [Ruminococcus sp.]